MIKIVPISNVKENNIIYCPNKKCTHIECLRHNQNMPFYIMVKRFSENPKLDKKGICKNYLI